MTENTSRTRRAAPSRRLMAAVALTGVSLLLVSGCGSSSTKSATATDAGPSVMTDGTLPRFPEGTTIKVVTHDSFAASQEVLDEFTAETGVKVEILPSGDAGTMVNTAILTKDSPQGDLLFGIDENQLATAFDAGLFQSYAAAGLDGVPTDLQVDPSHRVTPIDHGDVCVNFDRPWFTAQDQPLPTGFDALASADLSGRLVVEDPSTSTPGLSFLLATIAHFGGGDDTGAHPAWLDYWRQLKADGVTVVDSWETAYYSSFSGGSGTGDRPLVVSYASSPPAEVTDPTVAVDATPTGVVTDTCYRQTEFAGVLAGSAQARAAEAFIEFMLTPTFQQDMPAQMYVYPVLSSATLPEVFEKYTAPVSNSLSIPFADVAANRDRWIQQWSSVFR